MQDALRQIAAVARKINPDDNTTTKHNSTIDIDTSFFSLPLPQDISHRLQSSGLQVSIISELSAAYMKKALELHKVSESQLRHAWRGLVSTMDTESHKNGCQNDLTANHLLRTYVSIYERQLNSWSEDLLAKVKVATGVMPLTVKESRNPFNHVCFAFTSTTLMWTHDLV